MSTPPQSRRSSTDKKPTPPVSSIVTRNGARKAKIQTRAMSAGAKPSALVIAAKKKAQQKKKSPMDTVIKDHYQIAMDSKYKVRGPTGLVTDTRMTEHRCLWDPNYPECPERLTCILERCEELKLLEQCKRYESRPATLEELSMLHSPSVYSLLEHTHQNKDQELLEEISSKFDAIYIHPSTHELALLAAGSTIDLVENIVKGEIQNGMALVRPPGHHAMRTEPCGYCFYNNVGLAAKHAVDNLGLQRVLIVDWDVHHGQATQQMFYDDPRVVYFSIHRFEHGAFWPALRQAGAAYCGRGAGAGRTLNVPLDARALGDADYLAVFHHLLLPLAFEFQPELIVVSAGYDAALGCPEFSPELVLVSAGYDAALGDEKGEMRVSAACFAQLTQLLQCACARVAAVLEGGYCLRALAEGAALTLRALLQPAPPALATPYAPPSDSIRDTILNCIYVHKRYWRCFVHQPTYSTDPAAPNVCDGGKRKHKVEFLWKGDETRPDRFETRDCYPVQDEKTKRELLEQLNHLRIATDLSLAEHPVSYAYDRAMLKHRNICEPQHVESPERVARVHERHRECGLLARVRRLAPAAAADRALLAVHDAAYLDRLKELSTTKLRDLNSQKEDFDSVYFHPDSLESARAAAGCVLQAVEAVVEGGGGASAVCVVRPPGHHAEAAWPAGFCLLNNAAVGARAALARGARRVLLLDWDVHHGNGTQNIFYEDPQVLYISLHRYDNGTFFPHSRDADYDRAGAGAGEGFNINIPWNKRGMGDAEYLAAFTQVVLPVAAEFRPDLVLVSAGFDACVGDPLGGCNVTPECYGRMTQLLRSVAGGKMILCLEGGYNVTSTAYAMTMCTKALLGDPICHNYDPKAACHRSAVESIAEVVRVHAKYWKNLKFQLALPAEDVPEPPPPSRGLALSEADAGDAFEIEKLSESLSSTLTGDGRSPASDSSLEGALATLSVGPAAACVGGNCGTDDEEEASGGEGCSRGACPGGGGGGGGGRRRSTCGHRDCGREGGPSGRSAASGGQAEGGKTLVDYLAENMQAIANGEMFAVVPLPWCPHLEELRAPPAEGGFEQHTPCVDCGHVGENWVCLHCYVTACARGVRGHMQRHFAASRHALALSLSDLSAWCSACDAYVDHARLFAARDRAHRAKFGEPMPWCYAAAAADADADALHLH